jgi:hypothetical protein
MFTRHDLRCGSCGSVQEELFSGDPPKCSCGGERTITFQGWPNRRYDNFTPVTLDGRRFESRAELDGYRKEVAENMCVPVDRVVVEDNSPQDRGRRADEAMQRHVDKIRRAGYDSLEQWKNRERPGRK